MMLVEEFKHKLNMGDFSYIHSDDFAEIELLEKWLRELDARIESEKREAVRVEVLEVLDELNSCDGENYKEIRSRYEKE